jgi:CIC family chloride channel protein
LQYSARRLTRRAVPPSDEIAQMADQSNMPDAPDDARPRELSSARGWAGLAVAGLAVGALSGLVGVAFRFTLDLADAWRGRLIEQARASGWWALPALVCLSAACGWLSVWLVRRFAPHTAGSGIPHVEETLRDRVPLPWLRTLVVKFAGGALSIGGGMTLGREGPTVQMGAALGELISRGSRRNRLDRSVLIGAGAGAGLATAFSAPLAGLIFVAEELFRAFSTRMVVAAFVACVGAGAVTMLLHDVPPLFQVTPFAAPPLTDLWMFLLVGVAAGLLGVCFNRTLLLSLRGFDGLGAALDRTTSLRGLPAPARGALGGAIVGAVIGLLGWFMPQFIGGGDELVQQTLAGRIAFTALPMALLLRFALIMICYGCGAAGGIFAPLLAIAALLGALAGELARTWLSDLGPDPTATAIVAMAAVFAAIVRAPLTGIALLLEMTGCYGLLLPMLAASCAAYLVALMLRDQPIYEALRERDLARARRASF